MRVALGCGDQTLEFDVAEANIVRSHRQLAPTPIADVSAAVHAALDQPHEFPALRLALTPDDHVVIVVDEALPRIGSLVTPILEQVAAARIAPELITLLFRPGATDQSWIDDIPDAFQDVHMEVHDPNDRNKLSYLATTKRGRRVYLNRTLVDADQAIVLSGRRYHPLAGYGGGATELFPALSDQATRIDHSDKLTMRPPEADGSVQQEAAEICWLLGTPFFVQVIEGSGNDISAVVAGLVESGKLGQKLLDERWRVQVEARADIVVAGISAGAPGQDLDDLAWAFASAARVVKPSGRIFLLSSADPPEDERLRLLSQSNDAGEVLAFLRKHKLPDMEAPFLWASAAQHASLYLLSSLPPNAVEDLLATPLDDASQVQRNLDGASVLFLPDAHKTMAVVES